MLERYAQIISCTVSLLWLLSCNPKSSPKLDYDNALGEPGVRDWLIVQLIGEPSSLNPTNYVESEALYILEQIYQTLLKFSHQDGYPLKPWLAKELPQIAQDGLSYTFTLREGIQWDNGQPVTAEDVLFSIKFILTPQINCPGKRVYLDKVKDFKIDPNNKLKFTISLKERYALALMAIGTEIPILPAYLIDPDGIYTNLPLSNFIDNPTNLTQNARLNKLAAFYNSKSFETNKSLLVGSGAYKVESWEPQNQIVLSRKTKWWADNLNHEEPLQAFPAKIIFRQLGNAVSQVQALKNQEFDLFRAITPRDFTELLKDPDVLTHYRLEHPSTFAIYHLLLNTKPKPSRKPVLISKLTRRAFAHVVNTKLIIDNLYYGLGEPVANPIFPQQKNTYHHELKPIPFDLKKADSLLKADGWSDHNQDGIKDKKINGYILPFEVELLVLRTRPIQLDVANIIKQDAEKVGVKVNITALDQETLIQRLKNRDFDIVLSGIMGTPSPIDLKQIWSRAAWLDKNGDNYTGFGTEETDKLIEQIRVETDETKRNLLYKRFQEIIYDEQPYVLLMCPHERLAIHRRFRNSNVSGLRPGLNLSGLWVPPTLVKFNSKQ